MVDKLPTNEPHHPTLVVPASFLFKAEVGVEEKLARESMVGLLLVLIHICHMNAGLALCSRWCRIGCWRGLWLVTAACGNCVAASTRSLTQLEGASWRMACPKRSDQARRWHQLLQAITLHELIAAGCHCAPKLSTIALMLM